MPSLSDPRVAATRDTAMACLLGPVFYLATWPLMYRTSTLLYNLNDLNSLNITKHFHMDYGISAAARLIVIHMSTSLV